MAASLWKRAMVYLGLADDEDYAEYGEYDDADAPPGPAPSRASSYPQPHPQGGYGPGHTAAEPGGPVRVIGREDPLSVPPTPDPAPPSWSGVRPLPPVAASAKLHVVTPTQFDGGAKEIGDRFKGGAPVIMNLSLTDKQSARRLLDFASGLVYGLGGRMQPVGEGTFLLTPSGVEVSAEEQRRLRETGVLFDDR